jgi:hypothetical protein
VLGSFIGPVLCCKSIRRPACCCWWPDGDSCARLCCCCSNRLNSFLDHVDVGEYVVEGDLEAYSCKKQVLHSSERRVACRFTAVGLCVNLLLPGTRQQQLRSWYSPTCHFRLHHPVQVHTGRAMAVRHRQPATGSTISLVPASPCTGTEAGACSACTPAAAGKLAGLDKKLSRSLDAEVQQITDSSPSPFELSRSPVGPLTDPARYC